MEAQRMKALIVSTSSPEETMDLGRRLARWLSPGDTVNLVGDLGAGKTVFVKGMAAGLGIDPARVTSPTFALIHEYTGDVPLFHFDTYRLKHPEEWENLGYEEYLRGSGISVVEWGDLVEPYLPSEYLQVKIERDGTQENKRTVEFRPIGRRFQDVIQELGKELQHADTGYRYRYDDR
ncbi:MAG TPA: tRNA (adenosine(37)-N6)-threonylcarbamoyltransferase complex ATPase subunit type 1 TsaE [Firmicutes bacterium]|nr:tRNA (adenosine(37)-N6)-threonylcarbamoyltransferase complex ATPase subunit type 1 TsaE [Bacillota bacterium]